MQYPVSMSLIGNLFGARWLGAPNSPKELVVRVSKEVFDRIWPDSSNEELRALADETGIEISDLWEARRARRRYFELGVRINQRRFRR